MVDIMWWTGFLVWVYILYWLVWVVYYYFFYRGDEKHITSQFKGEWALVTGSSYGLGRSYAIGLARRGLNVILMARSEIKLRQVAQEIEEAFPGIKTLVIVADFQAFRNDPKVYERIEEQLPRDEFISVLVNNVGGSDGSRLPLFLDESWEDTEFVRHFNSVPTDMFLRMLLPPMIKRKRGIVINVSSIASKHAMYYPSYCSGKAGINQLTDMLEGAYSQHGIIFQGALAGGVSTPALGEPKPDGVVTVSPDQFAEASLRFLGAPKTVASPHIAQALPLYLMDLLPRRVVWWLVGRATADLINKKLAKEKEAATDK